MVLAVHSVSLAVAVLKMFNKLVCRGRAVALWFDGRKTIYFARLYTVAGFMLAAKDALDAYGIDVSHYMPQWLTMSPEWPFVLMGTGMLFEGLRWVSRNPVVYLQSEQDKK